MNKNFIIQGSERKYRQNFQKISKKFSKNIDKISKKYRQNFLKISTKFPKNIDKIFNKIIWPIDFLLVIWP